jgi:hypothetical protein
LKGDIRRLSLVLLILAVLTSASIAYAPVTLPLLHVDPPETIQNPGTSFTVNITVQEVTDLFSYEFKLSFEPGILSVASVDQGPFLTGPLGTLFYPQVKPDYVYVAHLILGAYPGVSGSGVLCSITFDIIDAGECALDLYDTILIDSTGAVMPHDLADGHFETLAKANLVKKSAWPEHHHFDVSKDEDGNQTLNAIVKNLDHLDLSVRVVFDIMRDDALFATITTDDVVVGPLTQVTMSADFGPLVPADAGKYYVSARAYYSWTGTHWSPGTKIKTFSFAVVP